MRPSADSVAITSAKSARGCGVVRRGRAAAARRVDQYGVGARWVVQPRYGAG